MAPPWLQPLECGPLLRAARHAARLSQRELAAASGVSQRQICRFEMGSSSPPLDVATLLFAATDHRLQVVDEWGRALEAMKHDAEEDAAGRHYPAHVDLRSTKEWGSWWLDPAPIAPYIRQRPDWTFDRPALPDEGDDWEME